MRLRIALLCLLLAIAGCARKTTADAGAIGLEGSTAPQGTSLAYEHAAEMEVADGAAVAVAAERMAAACREQRFGDCALLGFEQSGGEWPSASVRMRLAPDGVASTLQLATEAGGTVMRRTTKAEDLAGALADLRRERESLEAPSRSLRSLAVSTRDWPNLTPASVRSSGASIPTCCPSRSAPRRRHPAHSRPLMGWAARWWPSSPTASPKR
jgi:hypothetical protein